MRRYRFFLDFAKEEEWLSEMARQGWELTGTGFGYRFRKTDPQETVIRIDFRIFASQDEFLNYRAMFEDSGWQHIAGSRTSGAQYFKRMSSSSSEDIFSDDLSRAERYRRLSRMWISLSVVSLVFILLLVSTGSIDLRALVQPKLFYLTHGLWEKSGAAFWEAFWFETPFALFRAVLVYSLPLSLALYLAFAFKSNRLYQQEKKHAPSI